MEQRFDEDPTASAGRRLAGQVVGLGELAAAARTLDGVVSDVSVAGGLHALSRACGVVLDLAAVDVDLLSRTIAAAVVTYDAVESTAVAALAPFGR
jgi:hypothetical protein